MRKRIVIVGLVLIGVVVGFFLSRSVFNREPEYRGQKLSTWFKQYYRTGRGLRQENDPQHEQAAAALRALGTNAIPFLVRECFTTNQESPFQTNVLTLLATLPGPFRFPAFVPAMTVRQEAASAIGEIKPPAEQLLPVAINWLNDPNQYQRYMAVWLLGRAGEGGEAGVPFLRAKLSSGDPWERTLATLSLDRLGPAARRAVPDLIEFVRTNTRASHYAYRALARVGPQASNAIPVLREKLTAETNDYTRASLATALICIDDRQAEAMAVLKADLANTQDTNTHRQVVHALKDIGTNARPALPLLVAALNDPDMSVWHPALSVLLSLGETNLAISTALEKLKQDDRAARYNAMTFLLRVQPTSAAVMSNLVVEVNELAWGSSAIDEAARLGALAQPVIPRLREIAGSKTNPYRATARKALAIIEADMAEQRAVPDAPVTSRRVRAGTPSDR